MLGFSGSTGATNTPPSLTNNRIRGAMMATSELPSPALLRQLLRYEPATGKLFWLTRSADLFRGTKYSQERAARSWNSRYAGQEAFTDIGSHGYRNGMVQKRHLLAHRVIWAIQTGAWPESDIDHVNGDRTDNKWGNLRACSHAINLRNAAGKSSNKSGATGVNWRPERGKWRARIMVDGKDHCLGHFDSFDEALEVRRHALNKDGFSLRHGTFA